MDLGTYVAASAGVLQFTKLDIVNHNLANVNTVGYKREYVVSEQQSFEDTLASTNTSDSTAESDQALAPGAMIMKTATDFSPGPVQNTGNPLDVALRNANDFFVVNTPEGQQYTRAGNFSINQAGELVTSDGFQVMGDGGPISITGTGAYITESGALRSNQGELGRLQVVRIEKPEDLKRASGSRFGIAEGQATPEAVEPQLVGRSLEMSNVSAISSVIDLINVNRAFDMYSKMEQTTDYLNQLSISQLGRRVA